MVNDAGPYHCVNLHKAVMMAGYCEIEVTLADSPPRIWLRLPVWVLNGKF